MMFRNTTRKSLEITHCSHIFRLMRPFLLFCCSPHVPDRADGGPAAAIPLPPPSDCLLAAAALRAPGPHRRAGAGLWAEPAQPARVCQLQAHECAHRQGDPKKVKQPVLRIRDVYPGSRISVPGSKTATKEKGEKKCCQIFFCSHNYHKIEIFFIFEMLKKKIWASFQRIIEVFTQKFVTNLSNIWVWDPEKTYPGSGSRGQKGTGFGSATLKTTIFLFKLEFGTLFSLLQDKNLKYS
jgi:hypothetical protein